MKGTLKNPPYSLGVPDDVYQPLPFPPLSLVDNFSFLFTFISPSFWLGIQVPHFFNALGIFVLLFDFFFFFQHLWFEAVNIWFEDLTFLKIAWS